MLVRLYTFLCVEVRLGKLRSKLQSPISVHSKDRNHNDLQYIQAQLFILCERSVEISKDHSVAQPRLLTRLERWSEFRRPGFFPYAISNCTKRLPAQYRMSCTPRGEGCSKASRHLVTTRKRGDWSPLIILGERLSFRLPTIHTRYTGSTSIASDRSSMLSRLFPLVDSDDSLRKMPEIDARSAN